MHWLIAPAIAVFALLLAGYHFFFRFSFVAPDLNRESNFQTYNWHDVPYIVENGIPYPGTFKSTTNPRLSLDGCWLFRLDPDGVGEVEEWFINPFTLKDSKEFTVPGCFNTAESSLHDYEGAVWYQKVFSMNEEMNKDITEELIESEPWLRLSFMGSFYKTYVWLNGEYLGCSEDGYLPFYFDVGEHINRGEENLLTVKVDNRLDYDSVPPKLYEGYHLGWHAFGGIHKSVFIEACPRISCFKLRAWPKTEDNRGFIKVQALLNRRQGRGDTESFSVNLRLTDPGGKTCARGETIITFQEGETVSGCEIELAVSDPQLWEFQSPNLYTLSLSHSLEETVVNFGFRTVEVKGTSIMINSRQVFFKGISRHEEDRSDGLAMKPDAACDELDLIEEMNCNYVRLSHYPHHPATLDECDRRGLYVWEEIPLYQAGGGIVKYIAAKSIYDKKNKSIKKWPSLLALTTQLLRPGVMSKARSSLLKLVERDANHPSIVFWGIGNENWSVNPAGGKALGWLKKELLQFDDSRPVSYAAFTLPVITNLFERCFAEVDIIAVNEYYGWYYGKVGQEVAFIEKLHRKYPSKPIIVSETGSDTAYGTHTRDYPPPKGYAEEYQEYLLKTKWEGLRGKHFFAGWSPWIIKDFYCPEYREDNPVPFYNLKGLVDYRYRKKKAYYLLQSLYKEDHSCYTGEK